jgi:hypothetical protein
LRRDATFRPVSDPAELDEANALLATSALAGVRLASWTGDDEVARFEVFHVEHIRQVFGHLVFRGVRYLQAPDRTAWGYRIRTAPDAHLPSRGDVDRSEIVYELYAPDGGEPSAFIVAEALTAIPGSAQPAMAHRGPGV